MPFVVENGTTPNKYRVWRDYEWDWTESIDEAIWYARRQDAELLHAEDCDACFIREIDMKGRVVDTVDLLHLFQEFCVANATQWKLGAGDHHHPIWGMVSEAINHRVPITEGVSWAFIQPTNRLSLEELRKKVDHGTQA